MRHLLAFALLSAMGSYLPASLDATVDQTLRATVWFDEYTGRASFDINRPAHVALFAIRPLGGIEMIYPHWGWGVGPERAFHTGRHTVRTESRMYHLVRGQSARGRSARARSAYGSTGQTYIVLIASDRPLQLDGFMATGTLPWLNRASVTWSPFAATQQLAREIVRGRAGSDWTAAYHVIWPDIGLHRYDGRIPYTTVRCPGGEVISIPRQVVRTGAWSCPQRYDPRRPPRADTARPAKPRVPPITDALPRRPRPTDGNGPTVDERIRPATPARPVGPQRPVAPTRPATEAAPVRPVMGSRPAGKTGSAVKPRPAASSRPTAKPRPAVKPRPAAKPKPKPRPND